ncbi:hypothetical protein GUJ93_ZPchr0006g41579 [Zizania palustris]|uniref:Uncharacterized protein n=1 Tax=Zizania palustris TaxID=103762 RepID=A0A8J5SDP0_ZIZPA|nr:hypothetical protein GUJ93_ZPchr0006g41579 [Zizania palustris]
MVGGAEPGGVAKIAIEVRGGAMDSTVDSIAAAYEALFVAVAAVIAEPGCRARALQDLKHCLDAFTASCDQADDLLRAAADRVALAAAVPCPQSHLVQAEAGSGRLDALFRSLQAFHLPEEKQEQAAAGEHSM